MIKNGTKVMVNGTQCVVKDSHAAGKHRQYKMSDGSTIIDLHVMVTNNKATVLPEIQETSGPAKEKFRPRFKGEKEE